MNDHETERWLESAPLQELPANADQRIVAALLAAEADSSRRWWRKGIPLWQAAAACLAVFLITMAMVRTRPTAPAPTPPVVQAPTALAGRPTHEPPPYRTDISTWRFADRPSTEP